MYETKILENFSKVSVFSLSDVNQIISNKEYAKKFLQKMCKDKKIFKIKKNFYTVHNNDFLISISLLKPSYISSVSALSHYGLITQLPNQVFCATIKKSKKINKINFFHTNYFFGYKEEDYENFKILIAEPEKAVIDSFLIVPVSVFEEAFDDIDSAKMIEYLKKIKKSNITKRIGYLMEKHGYDSYSKLKNLINYKYVVLDPLLKSKGKKNKKWGIIDNTL